jgi:O-methyltransferase involved in polyketide biosynthesis
MFIIEGLVYYLPPEAFKASLTGISETAVAGSRLFFDFLHLDALSNEITMPGLETLLVVSGCRLWLVPALVHAAAWLW